MESGLHVGAHLCYSNKSGPIAFRSMHAPSFKPDARLSIGKKDCFTLVGLFSGQGG